MRRVRQEQPRAVERRMPMVMRLAAAAVAFAFLIGGMQFVHAELVQRERIATLRTEQQQIEAELAAVRQLVNESEPVVVLEDGKGTRVIMDLDTELEPRADQPSPRNYD